MVPDGSQMTSEDSEDMDWLEQFPGPESSPGTDLSGLDLDGHRTKQVSRSSCQKSGKSRLIEQAEWGSHGSERIVGMGERESWHKQLKGSSLSPQILILLECPRAQSLDFSIHTHFQRQFPILYF